MKSSSALVSHMVLGTIVALGAFFLETGSAAAAVMCGPGTRAAVGGGCIDIDECAEGTDTCSADELCVNRSGTFTCTCDEGFRSAVGGGCVDVDECAEGTDSCGQDELCVNRAGTFTCTCDEGYRPAVGGGCVDIDECGEGTDSCFGDQICTNRAGSFSCACGEGYRAAVGGGCVDIDECAEGTDTCSSAQTCTNRIGTFSCAKSKPVSVSAKIPAALSKSAGLGTASQRLSEEGGEDAEAEDVDGDQLCSAAPGGANPSAIAMLVGVGAVLVSRRRRA